jgi:hypothetical protein
MGRIDFLILCPATETGECDCWPYTGAPHQARAISGLIQDKRNASRLVSIGGKKWFS